MTDQVLCARPGCTRRVPKGRKKYCSKKCLNRDGQARWRARAKQAMNLMHGIKGVSSKEAYGA